MIQIKERPILFSAPMVRAILDGQKTVTRRAVKPQFQAAPVDVVDGVPSWDSPTNYAGDVQMNTKRGKPCPYGKPGDRLWVRESFWGCDLPGYGDQPCVVYDDEWHGKEYKPSEARPWARKFGRIPSIHMPREASRILLEIIDVRVERLKDISDEQAQAEGCFFTDYGKQCFHGGHGWKDVGDCPAVAGHQQREGWMWDKTTSHEQCLGSARHAFGNLWNKVNGPDAWDANPWVWVVEFKRITP